MTEEEMKNALKLIEENEELKRIVSDYENKAVSATILKDEMRIKGLEAQIEKMKCCGNCKKRGAVCVAEEQHFILCDGTKWELAE